MALHAAVITMFRPAAPAPATKSLRSLLAAGRQSRLRSVGQLHAQGEPRP